MRNSHSSYCPSKQRSSLCARKAQWLNLKEEFLLALTSINLMAKCHILKNASLSASCLIAFPSLDASAFSSFPRVIWNFISKGLHYHFPGAPEFVKLNKLTGPGLQLPLDHPPCSSSSQTFLFCTKLSTGSHPSSVCSESGLVFKFIHGKYQEAAVRAGTYDDDI